MSYRPYNQIQASVIENQRTNNTGVTINKATPTRINSSGEVDFVDVSNETQIEGIFSLAGETISNGNTGNFVQHGRVEDVTVAFSLGDPVYISKTGGLTNTKPSIGVDSFIAGDFVVRVGVVAKNESNPSLKDILVDIDIIGQL